MGLPKARKSADNKKMSALLASCDARLADLVMEKHSIYAIRSERNRGHLDKSKY